MPFSLPDSSITYCDLLCSEDVEELDYVSTELNCVDDDVQFPDDSDESMAGFIEGEAQYSPGFDYPDRFRSNSLDPFARQLAITWILKNGWALQLLSVACISLAAKMEETLVPSLLDLQVEGAKYMFEPRTVLRMEFLVLNALRWRLRSVTPFTFLDFFAYKIDPSGKSARQLISCATQIILETMHDIDFLSHCPSSLAAAAIICATDEIDHLALTSPGIAVSWCIGLSEDGIANCYEVMRRIIMGRIPKKCPVVLSQLRVSLSSGLMATSSYSEPNKRRKLNHSNYLKVSD